jgi:aminoglycoside phosphotransferase (APT) family kinase protein
MTAVSLPAVEDLREVLEMVREVIAHHLGAGPATIVNKPSGLSNFVYEVTHPEGEFVVRLGLAPSKLDFFLKERWAVAKVREAGIPTAEVLEVGAEVVPYPYMIARRAGEYEATHHPDRLRIVREMGRYAALINAIPTTGFGYHFDWAGGLPRSDTWSHFLREELDVEGKLAALERHRMLSRAQMARLRSTLAEIERWSFRPSLNHGDLRLKNVMVDSAGQIAAIIDWERCTSNRAPHWELSLALHDLSIDEKQEFLAGYGLSEEQVAEVAPVVKAFNLLNYAPEIQRLAETGETCRLEQCRTRLSGALDLYSL